MPTISELRAANCNCQESASDSYQRNENPGGGKRNDNPLVNDTITTISVGAASRKSARPASVTTEVSAFRSAWRTSTVRSGKPFARAVRTSARTLQRRLTEEGQTFQDLLDDVRRDVSIRHVEGTDLPLSAIAQMVGYSQQSAFFRSFRRWTGTTPAQFRRGAHERSGPAH